jgi:uncharacterized protein involved in outer membrane biogenesis
VKRLLLIAVALFCIAAAVFLSWAAHSTPYVRDHIVAALNARFDSQVDLADLKVAIYPAPEVSGSGLRLFYDGRTDVPPLITVGSFDASAGFRGLWGRPVRLHNVMLERMDIYIPPGGLNPDDDPSPRPRRSNDAAPPPVVVATSGKRPALPIVIDRLEARQAKLQIASGKAGKLPRVFDIQNLVVTGFGDTTPAKFQAGLINPVPRGHIETSGTFGPWNTRHPDQTALTGQYVFRNADLDVIKGIGGILSSVGSYKGVLERIEVEGQTETPDFSIDVAGQKVPLTTKFTALVDGTNGDTWLNRVEAKLAQSTIFARGAVVRTEDVKGRRISLDIDINHARIEDLMRLAVKASKAPLVGRVDVVTKFLLPAGDNSVADRLQLNGRFNLAQARFTNLDVQKKITMLSQRGRGEENGDGSGESIVSDLRGRFALRNARLTFTDLAFAVPGATVKLAGTYDLHRETMDFAGDLLTDASLSDMTHGIRSVLARLAQPFFRRPGGGTRLPIRISGTRTNPSFRVDVKRVFSHE